MSEGWQALTKDRRVSGPTSRLCRRYFGTNRFCFWTSAFQTSGGSPRPCGSSPRTGGGESLTPVAELVTPIQLRTCSALWKALVAIALLSRSTWAGRRRPGSPLSRKVQGSSSPWVGELGSHRSTWRVETPRNSATSTRARRSSTRRSAERCGWSVGLRPVAVARQGLVAVEESTGSSSSRPSGHPHGFNTSMGRTMPPRVIVGSLGPARRYCLSLNNAACQDLSSQYGIKSL